MASQEPQEGGAARSFAGHCPIERAMGLVGSRSAMLIMREAFYGTSRFDDFVQRVEMAPATASTHLRALTDAGLLQRQPYREPGGRTRDEYALTEAGADFMPVVFGHAGCGHPIEVRVQCTVGHEVAPDEIEWRPASPPPGSQVARCGEARIRSG
jgi:DNA-binding HxlR family transcriptional regulator